MRRIHTIRTAVNVSSAVLLLIITTAVAALIAGAPDPVLVGEDGQGVGILTVMSILGITAVIFGTPVVLAVNVFHWAAAHWFLRRERSGAIPPADQGQRQMPEHDPAPSPSDE